MSEAISKANIMNHIKYEIDITHRQLDAQSTSYDRQLFKGALSALRQMKHAVESGTFDLHTDEDADDWDSVPVRFSPKDYENTDVDVKEIEEGLKAAGETGHVQYCNRYIRQLITKLAEKEAELNEFENLWEANQPYVVELEARINQAVEALEWIAEKGYGEQQKKAQEAIQSIRGEQSDANT